MSAGSGFRDEEAKRIIRRAAEIDAERGHGLDVPTLREIAAEAGISARAVDQALDEYNSRPVAEPPRRSWLQRHRTLFVVALTIGLIAAAILPLLVVRVAVPPHP